jgi:hypothetical protein
MSYCRFQNTLNDLYDCEENLHEDLSEEESSARKELIELCQRIADDGEHHLDE